MSASYLLVLIAAVILTAALSGIFYLILRGIIRRSSLHMLKLSEYMRYAVIITVAVLAAGIGANYSSFLTGIAGGVISGAMSSVPASLSMAAILVLPLIILWRRAVILSDITAEKCQEWNTRTILAIIVSM